VPKTVRISYEEDETGVDDIAQTDSFELDEYVSWFYV
jgi:hypothetical protein